MVTLNVIRELLADLPGVKEGFSYGTRAFSVRRKLIARMHQKEDAVVVRTDFGEREKLMQSNPLTYYITDHYLNYPWVLVRLPTVQREELRDLLVKAWRRGASKSQIAEYESRGK
ncbi:MmcQ/YjbR family DNA-binding protein [Candidatus Parcubacteria bacterium]|nr:MAG: MmcQ/YjbR family DNA-binding protein [Candidatus Parcubacteria bacterium]